MTIVFSPEAKKQLANLPKQLQKKAQRQFEYLMENYRHPSLRSRKMGGKGSYEGRIDIHTGLLLRFQGKKFMF